MNRTVLLLLSLLMVGCPPQLTNDDDAADDDDSVADDDDSVADDDDSVVDDDDSVADDDDSNPPPRLIVPVEICAEVDPVNFSVDSWSIDGAELEAQVSYGGGCEVHDFHACWNGTFDESIPVQALIILQDYGPPDPCDAFITETVTFDLSPLSDSWTSQYGSAPGEITINLASASGTYSF